MNAGHRLFFKAVLGMARTGAPWRDGPARFGHGNSAGRRFDRGARKGVWLAVWEVVPDPDVEWLSLDSTVIRAPLRSGSQKKRTAPVAKPISSGAAAEAGSEPRFTPP